MAPPPWKTSIWGSAGGPKNHARRKQITPSIHRFSGPPRAAKEHKHRPKTQQEITPSIHRFTGTKNQEIHIKTNSNSPLVSSDLPDHRERPPNIKHDSKSPLISIDFRAQKNKKEAPK